MTGIADLITAAKKNPLKPVITGLLNESETAGLHGPPEAFKTIWTLQLAESIAKGEKFLVWDIPRPRSAYFLETEMSVPALGDRLARMFKNRPVPSGVHFATEAQLRDFRRASNLQGKFALVNEWVRAARAEVLILDTCNPFFRGKESPNDETTAGAFFDLLDACPAKTKLFVRHNHKRRLEDSDQDGAAKIRGSGQFGDVPDLLVELRRADKRIDKAILDVTKFRHGSKPDQLTLWFDRGDFRLIAVPPVIHLLLTRPLSRVQLLSQLDRRFGIKQRSGDGMINEQKEFLSEGQNGHKRICEIDWPRATRSDWFRLVPLGEAVQDVQDCISPPVYSGEEQPSL
jgi:AAA domain